MSRDDYPPNTISVTEILDRHEFGDPDALIDWACDHTRANRSWRAERDFAAAIGTRVHDLIEACFLEGTIDPWCEENQPPEVNTAMRGFCEWVDHWQPEFDLLEESIAIPFGDFHLGGTCDFKGRIKDYGRVLLDWKTSNKCQRAHKYQIAAYANLHQAVHGKCDFDGFGLVRFDKYQQGYEMKIWRDITPERAIMAALGGVAVSEAMVKKTAAQHRCKRHTTIDGG